MMLEIISFVLGLAIMIAVSGIVLECEMVEIDKYCSNQTGTYKVEYETQDQIFNKGYYWENCNNKGYYWKNCNITSVNR